MYVAPLWTMFLPVPPRRSWKRQRHLPTMSRGVAAADAAATAARTRAETVKRIVSARGVVRELERTVSARSGSSVLRRVSADTPRIYTVCEVLRRPAEVWLSPMPCATLAGLRFAKFGHCWIAAIHV